MPDGKPRIDMIVASGCRICDSVKSRILKVLKDNGIKSDFRLHDVESSFAVDLAVKHNLDTVPSFVVNGKAFNKPDFSEKKFLNAIRQETKPCEKTESLQ